MGWTWDVTLSVFRGMGGRAENVRPKPGGRGLVPVDPTKAVLLQAPDNLIFPISDLEFVDGRLGIKTSANVGKAERIFFDNYQESFSWGAGGRDDALAFVTGLRNLPEEVGRELEGRFGINRPGEDMEEETQNWFLHSRCLGRQGTPVMVPFLEQVEHASAAPAILSKNGIALRGTFEQDIRTPRSDADPLGFFARFGYASPEQIAFSLPLKLKAGKFDLIVARDINLASEIGSFSVPQFSFDGKSLRLSCAMIGNVHYPKLSKGIFYRVLRDAGHDDPEFTFDIVVHQNRMAFLKLLALLEPYDEDIVRTLRIVARHQLEAISHCLGSRQL